MKKRSFSLFAVVPFYFYSACVCAQTKEQNLPDQMLPTITITEKTQAASETQIQSLSKSELTRKAASTLGDALKDVSGVSNTYFGPNANRPVIRGLDGDRVRIVNNGSALKDVSGLSFDHATSIEPLSIERIDVLRGVQALSLSSSISGGVVNVIDNRIPRESINGFTGQANIGFDTGNRGKSAAFMLESGNDAFALHIDAAKRKNENTRVPIALPCTHQNEIRVARQICNSAQNSENAALGGSLFFDNAYLGASVNHYQNRYGTVAEDHVEIDMRSNRYVLEGEWKNPNENDFLKRIKSQFTRTDYKHQESHKKETEANDQIQINSDSNRNSSADSYADFVQLERFFHRQNKASFQHKALEQQQEFATQFKNKSDEFRLEIHHNKIDFLSGLNGVLGLQLDQNRFSVDGEEAFVPHSKNKNNAIFLIEEWRDDWKKLSFGLRTEQVRVRSLGSFTAKNSEDSSLNELFFVGERRFQPISLASSANFKLNSNWDLGAHWSYSERAPKDNELFANGLHIASATYEKGNADLQKEKAQTLEFEAKWKQKAHQMSFSVYQTRFQNYIGLLATGEEHQGLHEENEAAFPVYRYAHLPARFTGFEMKGNWRLSGANGLLSLAEKGSLDLKWQASHLRAINKESNEFLPRIAPFRLAVDLVWQYNNWHAQTGFDHTAAQNKVPETDRATKAYTLWNAFLSYKTRQTIAHNQSINWLWFARLDNITNHLAYSPTSILTSTVYPKVPIQGRSLKIGLELLF